MSSRHAAVTEFDRWVGANNIPERFEYGKGWWDYVELIRRFNCKFDLSDVRVIGDYKVSTPPPEEELPMPAVALIGRGVTVALKVGRRYPPPVRVSRGLIDPLRRIAPVAANRTCQSRIP